MTKLCTKCGVVRPLAEFYKKKSTGGYNPWCKPCYREWHRARYAVKGDASDQPRQCNQCGKTYVPAQRKVSLYCSRACKDAERNDRLAQARLESKPERQCLHCASHLPKSIRADAIFCSANCNEKAHALQRKLRMRTGQDGKPGYLRAEICTRDKWRCGICGDRVDPKLEHPDPLCASLDHVVPVCEGGLSEPANLRLVHLVCNLRRRHLGGGEQLAIL